MSIKEIADIILNTKEPEEIFEGTTLEEIKKSYRSLAKKTHPDIVSEELKPLAERVTTILNNMYSKAQKKIEQGIYNLKDKKEIYKRTKPLFEFTYRGKEYKIYKEVKEEDVSILYEGIEGDNLITLKLPIDESDNNLLDKEFNLLTTLSHLSLPKVIAKLKINGKTSLIMHEEDGLSPDDLIKEFGYIPEEHIAWILERLLSIIGYLHSNKIVHGNIKPENIIIDVENHNVKLMDYTLAIKDANETKSKYEIINEDYTPDYVNSTSKVMPSVDIYAIGKIAIMLMGGDIKRNAMPVKVNIELRTFIRKLLDKNENDAWKLWDELIELRNRLYGQTRFQKLERKLK